MRERRVVPFFHPVLFSKDVKAVLVDTFRSPELTSRETIAATVAPNGPKNN